MPAPFTVAIGGTYSCMEIPPRCRKPRRVWHDAIATVQVPVTTEDQAPVAFRLYSRRLDRTEDIRLHDGNLYTLHLPYRLQQDPTIPGSDQFPATVDGDRDLSGSPESADEFEQYAHEKFEQFLIIDDVVWARCGEPRYLVVTPTGWSRSDRPFVTTALGDNPNGDRADMYHRADDLDGAISHAVDIAQGEGDIEGLRARLAANTEQIDVLIPEAVALVPVSPVPRDVESLRSEYSSAVSHLRDVIAYAEGPTDEADTFAEVARLRAQIVEHGYTPTESKARPYEADGIRPGSSDTDAPSNV